MRHSWRAIGWITEGLRRGSETQRLQQAMQAWEGIELIQGAHGQQSLLCGQHISGALLEFGLKLLACWWALRAAAMTICPC